MKPFLGEECCHFRFFVKWVSIGIYLHCGVGTGFHNSHQKSISDDMLFSSWLISQAEQDVLMKLGQSYTNCGIGRNYMFRATGRFITMSHIRWLYDNDCQLHRTAVEMDGSTSAGNLLQFLKESKDIKYCVLGDVFDHSSCQPVVVNETAVDHSQEAETIVLKDHGFNELSSFT